MPVAIEIEQVYDLPMELELPEEGLLGVEARPPALIPVISERDLAKLRHPANGGGGVPDDDHGAIEEGWFHGTAHRGRRRADT